MSSIQKIFIECLINKKIVVCARRLINIYKTFSKTSFCGGNKCLPNYLTHAICFKHYDEEANKIFS